ncbi:MAG: hypothetical protein KAR45_18355 [Desulfobacteraceae bacterium]|nr:hypothetical protein [Desulfobacteraceae bacterium]
MNWITILGIICVALGTIISIVGQNIESDRSSHDLKQNIQSLKETVIRRDQRILDLEKRVNVISSLEIRVNLDEITKDKVPSEKSTSAGIQSVVALFTKEKIRHRFVTDFQFSFQQLSPNIRRAMFVYRPEEPTKILGKSIDYLNDIEMFAANFTDFIDPIGFDRHIQEHMISLTVLLNGVEIVTLNNLAITTGNLYSGQLNLDMTKSFQNISESYQEQIEAKSK